MSPSLVMNTSQLAIKVPSGDGTMNAREKKVEQESLYSSPSTSNIQCQTVVTPTNVVSKNGQHSKPSSSFKVQKSDCLPGTAPWAVSPAFDISSYQPPFISPKISPAEDGRTSSKLETSFRYHFLGKILVFFRYSLLLLPRFTTANLTFNHR